MLPTYIACLISHFPIFPSFSNRFSYTFFCPLFRYLFFFLSDTSPFASSRCLVSTGAAQNSPLWLFFFFPPPLRRYTSIYYENPIPYFIRFYTVFCMTLVEQSFIPVLLDFSDSNENKDFFFNPLLMTRTIYIYTRAECACRAYIMNL